MNNFNKGHIFISDGCPVCGSKKDIYYGEPLHDEVLFRQDAECLSCMACWVDTFRYENSYLTRKGRIQNGTNIT